MIKPLCAIPVHGFFAGMERPARPPFQFRRTAGRRSRSGMRPYDAVMPRIVRIPPAALAALIAAWTLPFAAMARDIPLSRGADGHAVIAVQIGGQGPFAFALDTAAARTALVRDVALQLDLRPEDGAPARIEGLTGGGQTTLLNLEGLDFGAGERPALRVVTIDAPPDSRGRLAGFLGLDAFAGMRIEIDLGAMVLRPSAPPPEPDEARSLAANGFAVAEAEIDGAPALALIDTGLTHSIGNPALARALGLPRRAARATVVGAAPGRMTAVDREARSLRVGDIARVRMRLAFADLPVFAALGLGDEPALLAGMDVLDGAVIQLDLEAGRWALRPASSR